MLYARVGQSGIEEYPLSESEIKKRFPNTSFTVPFTPPDSYAEVDDILAPSCDVDEIAVEGAPVFADGKWSRSWKVEKASLAVLNDRKVERAKLVRDLRNEKLAASDWTQLTDAQVDSHSWAVYRQALRDISKQAEFPLIVSWPTEPA